MRLLIPLIAFMLMVSCGKKKENETEQDYPTVDSIAAGYLTQIENYSIEELFPDRCDRLTFLSLASAFVAPASLAAYEWNPGEWHRDTEPCYPDFSKSEISPEGIFGVLHYALTYGDQGLMLDMRSYGKANKWVMGEGDRKLTFMPQMKFILDDMLGEMYLTASEADTSSHKEHVLLLAAWLKVRYYGGISQAEYLILKNIHKSPLIESLLARLDDGNQQKSIEYLEAFPEKLPLEVGHENWGGCPKWLYFYLVKGVLDGN